jgi:RNA polymerase sigma-70 factor (ECF subfamily)
MLSNRHYKKQSDEELIALYKRTDDLEIVGELYDRYTALTYGVCLKYLKDREESRDAVMHIFEKMIASLKVHDVRVFKGWLYVTARNHCLMHIRAKKGKTAEELSSFVMETSGNGHQEDGLSIEGDLGRLEKCMENLALEQKQCVQLFYLQQKCYKEITATTGYDLKKVKSYIQNGKRNLKICMERNEKS